MPELLVEVGCEELPASACREIVEQAPELARHALHGSGYAGAVRVTVTPRRFALRASGLPERLPAVERSVRGPAAEVAFGPDGAPTRAAEGFARSQGIGVEGLVLKEGDGGRRFVFAEVREEGRDPADLVPELARRVVEGLRFSKTMRWGDGAGLRFSRPVRWIVAKLDERTIPFELHGLVAGDTTRGHRFLGGPRSIRSAGGYEDDLREVGVIASHGERRAAIVADLDRAAAEAGCSWSDPGGKLDEVVFLVEWPSVIAGRIDGRHMRLPPRVLVTAMQSHQRYFPLERPDGSPYPGFLAVSNGDPAHADVITRGNEDVLDARLQDAAFSVDRDVEAGLRELDARLDHIVFHQRLGSMAQKRERLVAGVGKLASLLGVPGETAVRAATLAKIDQGAGLVAEFSELEGYAAAHYARLAGEPEEVAVAIEEQYLPEGPDSPTPASEAGALLALAEKLDNLVGAFAVGESPSGSKDPYGLRRAAAGVVYILFDRNWGLSLPKAVHPALDMYRSQGADLAQDDGATLADVRDFIRDRLLFQLGADGVGSEAALAADADDLDNLPATGAWARAIEAARERDDFWRVWEAYNRCNRILRKAPAGCEAYRPAGDPGEQALADAIGAAEPGIEAARARGDLDGALAAAQPLAAAIDRFFVEVLVNADDPEVRTRRYALVQAAAAALRRVADFSKVTQGEAR